METLEVIVDYKPSLKYNIWCSVSWLTLKI